MQISIMIYITGHTLTALAPLHCNGISHPIVLATFVLLNEGDWKTESILLYESGNIYKKNAFVIVAQMERTHLLFLGRSET